MKLTKQSPYTGKMNTMELPITEQELFDYEIGRNRGKLIQNVFPPPFRRSTGVHHDWSHPRRLGRHFW